MVRLKDQGNITLQNTTEFQFHYGTIKRPRRGCKADAWRYFNSTMVRLKDPLDIEVKQVYYDFNSTMVRLKANSKERRRAGFT